MRRLRAGTAVAHHVLRHSWLWTVASPAQATTEVAEFFVQVLRLLTQQALETTRHVSLRILDLQQLVPQEELTSHAVPPQTGLVADYGLNWIRTGPVLSHVESSCRRVRDLYLHQVANVQRRSSALPDLLQETLPCCDALEDPLVVCLVVGRVRRHARRAVHRLIVLGDDGWQEGRPGSAQPLDAGKSMLFNVPMTRSTVFA
jgi:hypothetical protein